jgi:peptidoglycan/xylan/chitin deacetylase (PgdA/CDA1 family)
VKRPVLIVTALIVCGLLAFGAYKIFLHASSLHPAIVTPKMDAQEAVSQSFSGKMKRVFKEHVTYSDRANRPKLIALTFDDGPYPIFTPLLLDQLNKLDVRATFFLIGRDAQQWPELATRIERSGNEIADHTYTHPDLDKETPSQVRSEILEARRVLYGLVRDPAVLDLFRPPHGRYTVQTIEAAQGLGYKTVLWTDDSGDWRTVTPQMLAEHLERHATAPEIVLLHSGKLATIEMLPEIVARFRSAGYRFVTVGQLLNEVSPMELNHPAKRPV